MDRTTNTARPLLFVEAKRASATLTDVIEVEQQAYTAACACHIATGQPFIWTMTCIGSAAG